MKLFCFLTWCFLVFASNVCAQSPNKISGKVLYNNKPVPYVTIYNVGSNRGTISNEVGEFSINYRQNVNDTICFESIGYKTFKITASKLKLNSTISLKEDVQALNQVFVFGKKKETAISIVKNVLKYKSKNYNTYPVKEKAFVRERFIQDVDKIDIDYKKSTLGFLNEKALKKIQKETPRHYVNYIDFLGDVYMLNDYKNKKRYLKVAPSRVIVKESEKVEELPLFKDIDSLFKNTNNKEYWKVKSGFYGRKIIDKDFEDKDTLAKNKMYNNKLRYKINSSIGYKTLNHKPSWEFLHKPSRYNYSLVGGTTINNEDLYIIDFEAKHKGLYKGRLYISMDSYALVKASYQYMENKKSDNFKFLGFSKERSHFTGSILFEKNTENQKYDLKYLSYKTTEKMGIDRKVKFQKKKSRFLFDKKLEEISLGVDVMFNHQYSFEYVVLEKNKIVPKEFKSFKQKEIINVIPVENYSETLWEGYPSIQGIDEMKSE